MDTTVIFQFLNGIASHNNREWFLQNKELYEEAKSCFDMLISKTIARISTFDESVGCIQPSDCTYRIYRDTRFSSDKSPYKIHMGAYINAHGKKSNHFGYYLHLQPGNSMLGGGSICLPANVLKAIRQSIYDNIDEFRDIVEDPDFKQYFPVIGADFLKTAPKGFPKDFPYLQYLRCKEYICEHHIDDSFFEQKDFLDRTEVIFRQMKRLGDFINYTTDNIEDK